MPRKLKIYTVIRVVKEEYSVVAFTKEDARRKAMDPNKITVIN